MNLTKSEMETIILYNEEEPDATVYTYNIKLKNRLKHLSETHPGSVLPQSADKTGAVTYTLPKELVSIRSPYPEAKRLADKERALKNKGKAFLPTGAADFENSTPPQG